MTLQIETGADRWTRMIRSTGVVGLVSLVALFARSSRSRPWASRRSWPAQTARAFFVNASAGWVQVAMALASLSAIGLIWFVVDCRCCSAGWRKSTVAVRSRARVRDHAARVPAAGCERGCCLLRQRRPDLAVASYAFDAGSLGFANVWFALASFAAACGWLILLTRVVGRWLGWWAIASGLGRTAQRQ